MSMNTTFNSLEELINHLKDLDRPQCFTVNYLPDTEQYNIWIGNQPYYNYERLIQLEEQDSDKLREKLNICKKALRIYADENHYVTDIHGMEIEATAMIDKGEMARRALEESE
ncbi:hypothetical protein [Oceanobacillus kimchii]|uniref:hypothetical protein n=1 Tax=Oceanobacillus kimchii TaxID=746691 RepID=UPI002330628A|nr:hypothetical protein [Oceanobacillus kimchii]